MLRGSTGNIYWYVEKEGDWTESLDFPSSSSSSSYLPVSLLSPVYVASKTSFFLCFPVLSFPFCSPFPFLPCFLIFVFLILLIILLFLFIFFPRFSSPFSPLPLHSFPFLSLPCFLPSHHSSASPLPSRRPYAPLPPSLPFYPPVLFMNARILYTKGTNHIEVENSDVITIRESLPNSRYLMMKFAITSDENYHKKRLHKKGWGVMLYTSESCSLPWRFKSRTRRITTPFI